MKLFSKIPDRFFSVLASGNKELYVQALFVLRQAFKTELVIRRDELTAMLMDALEADILEANFSEEAEEEGDLHVGACHREQYMNELFQTQDITQAGIRFLGPAERRA